MKGAVVEVVGQSTAPPMTEEIQSEYSHWLLGLEGGRFSSLR